MSMLFSPLTLRNVTFPNRLWVAPMCQYSVDKQDGVPHDWHHVHLAQFASGGAGLIITEATAVNPEGRISPEDTGIWNQAQQDAWAKIVEAIHARGSYAGIQLAHAGRKASTWRPTASEHGTVPPEHGGWETVAPSAIAYQGYAEPTELDEAGITEVIDAFRSGAHRGLPADGQCENYHHRKTSTPIREPASAPRLHVENGSGFCGMTRFLH